MLATRSEQGMTLVDADAVHHFPARARVYDVSGAGDTVAAAVAAALAAGTTRPIRQYGGGRRRRQVGTAVARPEEILAAAHEDEWFDTAAKVLPAASAQNGSPRRQGRRVGFTNGCFDLLHPHVSLIAARRYCDCLIVGLNSDASVARLKGNDRPVQNEKAGSRIAGDVDAVVVFGEDTPLSFFAR